MQLQILLLSSARERCFRKHYLESDVFLLENTHQSIFRFCWPWPLKNKGYKIKESLTSEFLKCWCLKFKLQEYTFVGNQVLENKICLTHSIKILASTRTKSGALWIINHVLQKIYYQFNYSNTLFNETGCSGPSAVT